MTATFGHQLIANDGSGNPLETDLVYGRDQLDVSVALADTTAVPPVTFTSDSFSFVRSDADEAYRLSVRPQQETTVPTETQDTVPMLELWSPYFGRITRTGVSKSTIVTFDLTTTGTMPTRAYVASTGLRTFTSAAVPIGSTTINFPFDWMGAGSVFGALGLLSASQFDEIWYAGFVETIPDANAYDDYFAMVGTYDQMESLTNGAPTTITGAITPTTQDLCVGLSMPRATEVARVQAANAFSTTTGTTTSSGWNISSTPRADLSPAAGIAIVLAGSTTTIIDQQVQIAYANPYPEDQVAIMNALFRRTATYSGATLALNYGTTQYAQVPVGSSTGCPAVALDATIAIPSIPTLAGTELMTDGQTVTIDSSSSAPLTLAFAPTGTGSADDWLTVLYEVNVSGTALSLTTLREYSTLAPSVSIDPLLFADGHAYMFLMESRVGYPLAASRDYRTIAYPFGTGQAYSAIFQVASQ